MRLLTNCYFCLFLGSKKKDGLKKRKLGRNPRVPFTQHQVGVLEQKFRHTHYLSSVDVAELSAALNLTETRVSTRSLPLLFATPSSTYGWTTSVIPSIKCGIGLFLPFFKFNALLSQSSVVSPHIVISSITI